MKCTCCSESSASSSATVVCKQPNARKKPRNQQNEQAAINMNKTLTMLILMLLPKLLRALSSQSREAAQRIAQGLAPIPPDYRERWVAQLQEALREESVKALGLGWEIGGTRVPNANAPSLPEEARIPVTGTGDQLSSNDGFAPPVLARLFAFLLFAAKQSAETHAKRIQTEYDKKKEDKELDQAALAAAVFATMEAKDKNHADIIAKSNIVWAGNEGLLQRYKAEGITVFYWRTAGDELVCPACFSLDGTIVDADIPFVQANQDYTVEMDGGTQTIKGSALGVYHPPLHARCRCQLWPETVNVF